MSNKIDSRKYKLTKGILIAATAIFVLPPLITFAFLPQPLTLMSAVEWISLVSSSLLFYSGANVLEKKFTSDQGEK